MCKRNKDENERSLVSVGSKVEYHHSKMVVEKGPVLLKGSYKLLANCTKQVYN